MNLDMYFAQTPDLDRSDMNASWLRFLLFLARGAAVSSSLV
jgi:hypothetical protein